MVGRGLIKRVDRSRTGVGRFGRAGASSLLSAHRSVPRMVHAPERQRSRSSGHSGGAISAGPDIPREQVTFENSRACSQPVGR